MLHIFSRSSKSTKQEINHLCGLGWHRQSLEAFVFSWT